MPPQHSLHNFTLHLHLPPCWTPPSTVFLQSYLFTAVGSPSSWPWPAGGRAQPWWLHQTQFSGHAESKRNTPGTLLLLHQQRSTSFVSFYDNAGHQRNDVIKSPERTQWACLTYLLSQSESLRVGDWCQLLLLQLLDGVLLVSQIQLGAHQDNGRGGAVVANLRVPLRRSKITGSEETWEKPSSSEAIIICWIVSIKTCINYSCVWFP